MSEKIKTVSYTHLKIRYDGININNIKKNDLRRSLGIVLQDTNLFTGTPSLSLFKES